MLNQAIFTLARRGDLNAVKRALDLDADPNIPDTLGILEADLGPTGEATHLWWKQGPIFFDSETRVG